MSRTNQPVGQMGGLALVSKYGHQHMSDIGKLGGRPTLKKELSRVPNNNQEVAPAKASFNELLAACPSNACVIGNQGGGKFGGIHFHSHQGV